VMIITADHGNADEMWMRKNGKVVRSEDGQPVARTAHTLNPVPCVLFDPEKTLQFKAIAGAGIASLGATVLELCGLKPPPDYESSLLL
jgi:2,3-bisphosphoglycerate-independent phosphoglycerate mutase